MKKINYINRWFSIWFHKVNLNTKVKDLTLQDRKNTILDQLSFGLNVEDRIKLFEMVSKDFNIQLDKKNQECLEITSKIEEYFSK